MRRDQKGPEGSEGKVADAEWHLRVSHPRRARKGLEGTRRGQKGSERNKHGISTQSQGRESAIRPQAEAEGWGAPARGSMRQ